jgi:hypothetical protein
MVKWLPIYVIWIEESLSERALDPNVIVTPKIHKQATYETSSIPVMSADAMIQTFLNVHDFLAKCSTPMSFIQMLSRSGASGVWSTKLFLHAT